MKNYSYMLWILVVVTAVLVYLQSLEQKSAIVPETSHTTSDGPIVDTVPIYPNNTGKE